MKQRILLLFTVVALMVAMMVVMAAPASARINCAFAPGTVTLVCSGGEGGQGGGGGGHRIENFLTSDLFFAFGHGGPGGGEGGLCTGPLRDVLVCHGSRTT